MKNDRQEDSVLRTSERDLSLDLTFETRPFFLAVEARRLGELLLPGRPSSKWHVHELRDVLHAGSTANAQIAELMRLANDLKTVARRMELKHANLKGGASSNPPSPS